MRFKEIVILRRYYAKLWLRRYAWNLEIILSRPKFNDHIWDRMFYLDYIGKCAEKCRSVDPCIKYLDVFDFVCFWR